MPITSYARTFAAQPSARKIGIVYLFYPVTALLGTMFLKGIVVLTDSAATATNILAHESLYRAGFALDLIGNILYLTLAALLYAYFRPVSRHASMIAGFCGVAGC